MNKPPESEPNIETETGKELKPPEKIHDTPEALSAQAATDVARLHLDGLPVIENVAASLGSEIDPETRQELLAVDQQADEAKGQLQRELAGYLEQKKAFVPELFPGDATYHDKVMRLQELVPGRGRWVSVLGQGQLNLVDSIDRLGAENFETAGIKDKLAMLLHEKEESQHEAQKDESLSWFREHTRQTNKKEIELLRGLTPEAIDKANKFIATSALPEEMKQVFLLNAELAHEIIGSGELERSVAGLNEDEAKKELSEAEKRAGDARVHLEAVVDMLTPVFDALAGEATERLHGEYEEKYLRPTIDALLEECPGLDAEQLVDRAKRFTIEAVSTIGKNLANWDEVGGVYDPENRAISVPFQILEDEPKAEGVITHETLHALSQGDSVFIKAAEKIPPKIVNGEHTQEPRYTKEQWQKINSGITEGITEELSGRVLARRGKPVPPEKLSYRSQRFSLNRALEYLNKNGHEFSMADLAKVYFSEDKNLEAAWPKIDDEGGALVYSIEGMMELYEDMDDTPSFRVEPSTKQ